MIKVVGKRDTGKTRQLLTECSKVNGLYVCKHPERIYEKCIAYNIPLVNAIHYKELKCCETRELFIDDVDCFLENMYMNIKGIALVSEEE